MQLVSCRSLPLDTGANIQFFRLDIETKFTITLYHQFRTNFLNFQSQKKTELSKHMIFQLELEILSIC